MAHGAAGDEALVDAASAAVFDANPALFEKHDRARPVAAITRWHDAVTTTHAEVLGALDYAIWRAREADNFDDRRASRGAGGGADA